METKQYSKHMKTTDLTLLTNNCALWTFLNTVLFQSIKFEESLITGRRKQKWIDQNSQCGQQETIQKEKDTGRRGKAEVEKEEI